jgi:hypothetical protein
MPATYLNQERWNDEITPVRSSMPVLPIGTKATVGKFANVEVKRVINLK